MKIYQPPKCDVIKMDEEDIVRTSFGGEENETPFEPV